MSDSEWFWIEDVSKSYIKARYFSTTPGEGFQKVEEGHIFDEEKSVRWNREEVARINNEYKAEEDRLKEIKRQEIDEAEHKIHKYIVQRTNLSLAQASLVWDYVYKKFDAYGYTFEELDDMIEFYNELQET